MIKKDGLQVSVKKIISILLLVLEIIPIAFLFILSKEKNIHNVMVQIGIIALICFMLSFASVRLYKKRMTAFVYFIIFIYIFSFGQCFMSIVGSELKDSVFAVSAGFFSNDSLKKSSAFVLVCVLATCIGYIVTCSRKESRQIYFNYNCVDKEEKARIVGWILLCIGSIPTIIILYKDYIVLKTYGYGSTLEAPTGIYRLLTIISGLFVSGLLLLFCFEKKHRKLLYVIIVLYWVGQLAGGSRIAVFRTAIVFLLIEDLYLKKMTRKRWILAFVIGLSGVLVLSLVSSIRNYLFISDSVGDLIVKSFQKLWENNFVSSAVNEMGNTQLINSVVIDKCPSEVPYNYGLTYVKMILAILPNIFEISMDGVDATFTPFYTLTESGMGASYISELYWNFGYFAILISIVFGIFLSRLDYRFEKMCNNRDMNPAELFLLVYLLYYVIFLVRSEAIGVGRSFVYYGVLPYGIIKLRFLRLTYGNEGKTGKLLSGDMD